MKIFDRFNSSRIYIGSFCVIVFLFLMLLNFFTPYIADDYAYMVSFYDQGWIDSITDIIPSIWKHSYTMNGRAISHGLDQFFLLFPKAAFNVCNALVFMLLMYLLYRIANHSKKRNLLLFIGIVAAFWYYTPAFGQVVLWQVGAVNYLWALFGGIVFLCPYIYRFLYGKELLSHIWQKILFCIAALPLGMYSEVTSFIAVLLAFILLMLARMMNKGKLSTWQWIPIVVAGIGYVFMLIMPAEMAAKQGELTIESLLRGFYLASETLRVYGKNLLIAWMFLFIVGVYAKLNKERLILSFIFFFGAIAGNFMLTVASYYPDRCAATSIMLLILANAVLVSGLLDTKFASLGACYGGIVAICCVFSLISGTYDIYRTYTAYTEREALIEECIERGETDLKLPLIHPNTQYSAYWGIIDLNTETSQTWPNNYMSSYYGVNSIIGY